MAKGGGCGSSRGSFFTGSRYLMHEKVFSLGQDINMLNNPRPHRIRFVIFVH